MKNRLRDNWFKLGIFIILLTAWASIIHYYLYTLPEDLELKAMCAKKAEEFYQNNPPNKKIFAYEYHYNKRLNKCFISIPDSREEFFNNIYRSDSLYDVYENKTMASYLHIMPKSKVAPLSLQLAVVT
jgi:hypothetical protein